MLREGGRLVFVGATNEGIKGAVKQAKAIFGQAGIVARKGGYHAGLAQRPRGAFPLPAVNYAGYDIIVDGHPTRLVSCAGAFARDRLDAGAAALVAGMQVTAGRRVLDLGCGTGLAGLAALRRGAEVTLVDVSARAAASTQRTLAANGYPDAAVHLACGAAPIAPATMDSVVTNPPFHRGHGVDFEVAQLFVRESARVLKAGGKVYLVANAFLQYDPWLKASFSRVDIAWEDRQFRVWEGVK
jgi:16S rRNA (guanine1207-N2)-methyltransferase